LAWIPIAGLLPATPATSARANFSQEWGLHTRLDTTGDWREFDPEEVKSAIHVLADNPDLQPARTAAKAANLAFDKAKSEAIPIVEIAISQAPDAFLASTATYGSTCGHRIDRPIVWHL
jgi:hypothetical protein